MISMKPIRQTATIKSTLGLDRDSVVDSTGNKNKCCIKNDSKGVVMFIRTHSLQVKETVCVYNFEEKLIF